MEPIPEDWHRAIAVVAHPDDLEYGTAAAIARWTAQGKQIAYVLATSGEAGIDTMAPDRAGPLREDEERRSAAVVGVTHVEFLGYPDGVVEYGLRLRRDLALVIRRLQPDAAITINFDLTWDGGTANQADHRHVGLALLDACRDAGNSWLFTDADVEPWSGVHTVFVSAASEPTHYVDVTDTMDIGVASLREHKAYIQALDSDPDPETFVRQMSARFGEAVGHAFATPFRVLRL
jgi:LmbE family N-acetylglucosaminyl deacetylase